MHLRKYEEEGKVVGYGIVPIDDLKESSNKIVLLYENSQMVGKLVIELKILDEKPIIYHS